MKFVEEKGSSLPYQSSSITLSSVVLVSTDYFLVLDFSFFNEFINLNQFYYSILFVAAN